MEVNKPIILFDGVCNLCNSGVNFIIDRDKKDYFRFASLQSDLGQKLLQEGGIGQSSMDSFIYINGGKYYTKSTAALQVSRNMSGLWPLFYIFIIVPPFIRNWAYDIVARNRYRWFGKQDSCRIPTPELKSKFL